MEQQGVKVIASTFDGEALLEILAKTLLGANAIESGLVTVHTGFHKKLEIPILSTGIKIQDPSCKFTDGESAGIGYDPVYLEPKGFKVNEELCFRNLANTYFKYLQGLGEEANYNSTALMERFVADYFGGLTNQFIDAAIWMGSEYIFSDNIAITASSSVVEGLLPGIEGDSDVEKDVTPFVTATAISKAANAEVTVASTSGLTVGTDVTISGADGGDFVNLNGIPYKVKSIISATKFTIGVDTSAYTGTYTASSAKVHFINENNVIDTLTNVYINLPETVENDPDFVIIVNKQVYKAYTLACAKTANGAGMFMVGDRQVDLLGMPMRVANFFPKNCILATKTANLHYGAELLAENENINVLDMRMTTGDNTYRYIAQWGFDVNHTLGGEMFYVRPL